jgi:hypothetical protein
VSYKTIAKIPNPALLELFNRCIADLNAPQNWFTTVLVGVLKVGKPATDPDSYWLIGLECCLLKVLTLLIDWRIRDWAATYDILPDSQNGFWEAYCTHNNLYVLRCAIDKAHASGKTLYIAFIDLQNAFPSTNLPTLWVKLLKAGMSGPLFDWLQVLYARMSYVVKHGSNLTDTFKLLIGVLMGDIASPILWNIYFADLGNKFVNELYDIQLNLQYISHVEQADDVALFTTSQPGLQKKVNVFLAWCLVSFMTISAPKSKWIAFGPLEHNVRSIYVGKDPIELVQEYKYVGLLFSSVHCNIFAEHYSVKASKACNVANATFLVESVMGVLPPAEGKQLWNARIDSQLIFAAEVILDVNATLLKKHEDIQHTFIRRLLGLNSRSMPAFLFTETGITPIAYWQASLALGYLSYLINLPPSHYANAAYQESVELAQEGHPSWLSDLGFVLAHLPGPKHIQLTDDMLGDPASLQGIRKALEECCEAYLQFEMDNSVKVHLLAGQTEKNEEGEWVHATSCL